MSCSAERPFPPVQPCSKPPPTWPWRAAAAFAKRWHPHIKLPATRPTPASLRSHRCASKPPVSACKLRRCGNPHHRPVEAIRLCFQPVSASSQTAFAAMASSRCGQQRWLPFFVGVKNHALSVLKKRLTFQAGQSRWKSSADLLLNCYCFPP